MLTRRKFAVACVTTIVLIAAFAIWKARRQTEADKLIQQKLAALRAAGEPVTAQDLAKMFAPPSPEKDAMVFFTNALEFAATNRLPYNVTPIIGSGPLPPRSAALDEGALQALKTFYEDSAAITNLIPAVPDGVRFGNHWELGILDAPMMNFAKSRSLMQSLCTRALYAAETGDAENASQMLGLAFRFAGAIPSDSTLVEHMIRAACIGLASSVTERSLNRTAFNDRQLAHVLEAMPAADTNGVAGTLCVESCLIIYVFQEVKAGRSLDSFTSNNRDDPWWQRTWKKLRLRRNEYSDRDFLLYLDLIPELQRAARLPAPQASFECSQLLLNFQTNATSEIGTMAPNWSQALKRHYELEAQLAVTKLALAIARFRLTHDGQMPESLEALVPTILTTIPRDLFDERPLRFKPLAKGYVAYSIGPDGKDDGGTEKANATAQTNFDLTVTVER